MAEVGVAILGGLAAAKLSNIDIKALPEKSKKFQPLIAVVAGYFLLQSKGMAKAAGLGMAVVGGGKTIAGFFPDLGIGETEVISDYMIEGTETYALSGPENMSGAGTTSYALSGTDEFNSDMVG